MPRHNIKEKGKRKKAIFILGCGCSFMVSLGMVAVQIFGNQGLITGEKAELKQDEVNYQELVSQQLFSE